MYALEFGAELSNRQLKLSFKVNTFGDGISNIFNLLVRVPLVYYPFLTNHYLKLVSTTMDWVALGKLKMLYSKIFAIFRIYRERKLAHFTSILYLSLSFRGEPCVHGDTKCAHALHTIIKLSLTTGIYMIT